MFINNFIYFYIGTCALLIVFELVWVQYIKLYNVRYKKLKIKFKEDIINFEKGIERDIDIKGLAKKLKNVNNLIAFQNAYEEISKRRICSNYIHKIVPVFIYLNIYYVNKKNDMEKAYFAYVIGRDLGMEDTGDINILIETLYGFLNNKSINCRLNALNAICSVGKVDNLIKAVKIISNSNLNCNSILIANCLNSFNGSKKDLARKLFEIFDDCIDNIQISIIKFLANNSYISDEKLIEKLELTYISTDVKCEIMRYFQINISEHMKEFLINKLNSENIEANDLNIKAIGTLGYYNDSRVDELLNKLKDNKDEMILETAYRSIEKSRKNKVLINV